MVALGSIPDKDNVVPLIDALASEKSRYVLVPAEREEDLRLISPLSTGKTGTRTTLEVIGEVRTGPQQRRGIAELDGEGEVVGGIVVMRHGENALQTIAAVREKIDQLRSSLPEGVEIVETYDRSALITRAVNTLNHRLVEEFLRSLGCDVHFEHQGRHLGWPRVAAKCSYKSPVRFGELLDIRLAPRRVQVETEVGQLHGNERRPHR